MPGLYCFDRCEVRPAERQLLIEGVPAALGARAFDLLVSLIERHDRVVDKAELFDTVWPGLVVEENNLQVQVSSLRKLLGPNAIATVPGRGYQFVAALDTTGVEADAARVEPRIHPNNLPHARTRFIGRETALADCATLLHDTRLLTLSGIGGCGKTRLAQELAQRELGAFPDGVWFVDLGPLQEAQRVSATVAATLGVQVGQLTDHLKARRALVVMDNCEHVIGAAVKSIETLLETCGALKIIATSREVLGTAGEQVFAVRSLSLPMTIDLDEMRRSEAVRLFVDHARLVVPEFDVDERNAAAIAEICRRLDGIALAIELAAARVRVLQVDDIRARLDDRFRLLTGGNRALPRHQTLQATMQWSHDLLTPPEQQLFRRLAVFAGGCTLAAASEVTGDGADEYDVLERLTALHDKSLLLVDRDTQAQPRYRMLETVRQYAEERLNEADESDEIRTRHLAHYVALAERAEPEFCGRRQAAWIATFRHEQENLLAAHAWCANASNGGELALRLTGSSWRYWVHTAQSERGYQLAEKALGLSGAEADTVDRCRTFFGMSYSALRLGRYEDTLAWGERCLAMARRIGDGGLIVDGLTATAHGLQSMGRVDEALAHYNEACNLARAAGDEKRLSTALNGVAELHRASGNLTAAEPFYREAIRLSSQDPRANAVVLANLASLLVAAEKPVAARVALAESRSLAGLIGHQVLMECAFEVGVAAALASLLGEHAIAARFHGAMLRRLHQARVRQAPVDEAFVAPRIANLRAAMGDAAFDAAQAEGWALSYEASVAALDRWLGVV
jgi:predicted ATPase/DNA-binding winged helix-turn-helix (wHTH) protein